MKLDKETVIKYRFWFSIPLAVLFVFIALICVLGVRSTTMANWADAKRTDDQLVSLASRQDLRNERWIQEMKAKTDEAVRQKDDLWYELYDGQNKVERAPAPSPGATAAAGGVTGTTTSTPVRGKLITIREPFITWPARLHNEVPNFPMDRERIPLLFRDFGEPLNDRNAMPDEYKSDFPAQYEELIKLVDFLDETANPETGRVGSVRVPGSGKTTKENARILLNPPVWGAQFILDSEAWIAQEDVAIKRSLLEAIRDANNVVAHMEPEWRKVPLPESPKPPSPAPDAASGATVAAVSNPPQPADGGGGGDGNAASQSSTPKVPVDRQRFLNTTWQIGVVPFNPQPEKGPKTRWYDGGWIVDVEITMKGNEAVLRVASVNMSVEHKLPSEAQGGKLVFLVSNDDKQRPDEREFEFDFSGQEPTKPEQAGRLMGEVSTKSLLDVASDPSLGIRVVERPLGFAAKKIVRVQRSWDRNSVLDHQRYVNPYWVMDIRLLPREGGAGPGIQGVIYNRSGKRTMPPSFEVTYTTDGRDQYKVTPDVRVPGDAVNAGLSREFPRQEIRSPVAPRRLVGVRQILTWQTVPIKQINRLVIGQEAHIHSDRTKVFPLREYDFKKKNPKQTASADASAATQTGAAQPGGAAGGAAQGPMMGPTAGMGGGTLSGPGMGMGGGATAGALSANHKLPLRRYYEITDELRRVPVALVLIVEESRANDILAALANHRMRFRATMVVWNRVPSLQRPDFLRPQGGTGGAGGTGPGRGQPGSSGGLGPTSGLGTGGGRDDAPGGQPALGGTGGRGTTPPPRGGTAGGTGVPPTGGFGGLPGPLGGFGGASSGFTGRLPGDEETPQIEIQIYGLITLYESPDAFQRIQEERKRAGGAVATTTP
ncbi:MAG: hypothetical protein NZM31_05250 [Gemmatales bacterium]|nr:hypothetical protein [Gemmatales bacterium]MDW8386404.1 hypothetical protein [Gemmatales bacterium]